MFIVERDAYARAATEAMLTGEPFETLVDACHRRAAEVDAAKIVNIADMRSKLRPDSSLEHADGNSPTPAAA